MMPEKFAKNLLPPYTFGGLINQNYNNSEIIIIPAPYDSTTSYQTGCRDGPHAIISASRNMELYDHILKVSPSELGIFTLDEVAPVKSSSKKTVNLISEIVSEVISDGKFPVLLGGEHTVSLGTFLGLKTHYPEIGVLHFDAHGDRREEFDNSKICHATVIRRISEYTDKIFSIGVRSVDEEEISYLDKVNHKVVWSHEIDSSDISLEIKSYFKNMPVFLTIDIDVFDPAFVPGTGTPEPDGLSWQDFWCILSDLFPDLNIVGFDVVEVRPIPGDVRSEFFAARLIYKLLAYKFYKKD